MDSASRKSSATTMSSTYESGASVRKTLKRWKDRWRVTSNSSSSSIRSASSLSRPSTNTSPAAPAPTSAPSSHLYPVPGSPLPISDPLFTPTTQTFIHSPADPRSRTGSSNSSPAATLRKSPPISRRNTTTTEHFHGIISPHPSPPARSQDLPLNTVTTTIVAGNDTLHKKRSSRFRLSISKTRSSPVPPSLHSPSSGSFFDRSSSRATGKFDPVEETKVALTPRKRADTKVSENGTLLEEKGAIEEVEKTEKTETPGDDNNNNNKEDNQPQESSKQEDTEKADDNKSESDKPEDDKQKKQEAAVAAAAAAAAALETKKVEKKRPVQRAVVSSGWY